MKKGLKIIIFTLIGLIFIGTFVFLFQKSRKKEIQYNEYEVAKMDIQREALITGKISPRNEVAIKPQINGIIAELYKEAGQEVKENEVIAKLKVIPDMNSLSAAQSRVRLAEINYEQSLSNYKREKMLYDQKLISQESFEKTTQLLNQAREEKSAAQDALEIIRDGVSSTNATSSSTLVRSTISGLILDVPVKVGNSVIQANTLNDGTTVATIANMNDLIFTGSVDETEVGTLQEGMPLIITIGALQNLSFEATLEYIAPKATESNGTNKFEIKAAVLPQKEHKIRSGYSANAKIILEQANDVLAIPESALEFEGDSTFVYVKKDGNFTRQAVTTGLSDGINIQITNGLKEGDKVRGSQIIFDK
ncbi:MAG: efflux RND transporter periplasmic adaptor subunit [Bacteroidales bacterium]|nr:efflux RND transporter periplasmic adaptor subunit [Bacteroidales bacterium]